jgi:hypothetical protein
MGSVIKVEKDGMKQYLAVNEEKLNQSLDQSKWNAGYSTGLSFLGLIGWNSGANIGTCYIQPSVSLFFTVSLLK